VTKAKTATKKATTATPTEDALLHARDEVARLNDAELRQGMLVRMKAAELAAVRRERGDAVLDADDPAGVAREVGKRVAELREEQASFADAARRARERRIAAIPLVYAAESDAKEAEAAAMEVEASRLEEESKVLRAALEAHDDWGYLPAEGKVDGEYVAAVAYGGGPGGREGYRVVDARGPKFMRLRGEAQALRSQAAQGRFKVAHRAGAVGADSVEDLISVVHSDAMRIGPSAADIIAFVDSRTAGAVNATDPLRVHLVWVNGVIDTAQSHVSRLQVAAPRGGSGVGETIDRILGAPVGAASPGDHS
jgi:hypothetical protein